MIQFCPPADHCKSQLKPLLRGQSGDYPGDVRRQTIRISKNRIIAILIPNEANDRHWRIS
jgi:hypothetical protein